MHIIPNIIDEAAAIKYIEIDFINDYADFELVSVQPRYNCSNENLEEISKLVSETGTKTTILSKARESYF